MTRLTSPRLLIVIGAAIAPFWRPAPATAQTALFQVDKGEVKLLEVYDDAGLVVRGRENEGQIPAFGTGTRLMWYPRKFAFRVGRAAGAEWDDVNVGAGSVAMGQNTIADGGTSTALGASTRASGVFSTAMGDRTIAAGGNSTAMGELTNASGTSSTATGRETKATAFASTAMGYLTTASGDRSTALGTHTTASGLTSTAMGLGTEASGLNSTAMGSTTAALGDASTAMGNETKAIGGFSTALGSYAAAFGQGSFAYGDRSTTALITALPNEFVVRASGGFRLRTNPSLSTGCDLPAGSGSFNCTSSRLAKEGFEDVDGETVLNKLATLPIQRWQYRGTDARHVGPTAEDFHAAFQLGQGPTTISTVDADGISLLAVQALGRRTAELRDENAVLRAKLAEESAALRTELEALRRIIETGRVAP